MAGNGISYRDLLDDSDRSVVVTLISDLEKLTRTYQDFHDIVINGQISSITEQQKELTTSIRALIEASKDLNTTQKKGQDALIESAKKMAAYEAEMKKLNETKAATKRIDDSAAESVNGLTKKLNTQLETFKRLDPEIESQRNLMKQLASDISQTRDKIKVLTDATKICTSTFNAAKNSYNALDQETKKLKQDLLGLENGMDKTNTRAKELQRQINANTKALKDFDKEIGQNSRNVGNYSGAFASAGQQLKGYALALVSIAALTNGVSTAFDKALNFDSINKALEFASGNVLEYNRNMEFLRTTADKLGLSFEGIAKDFTFFAAATKGTNLEGEQTRVIFEAVAKAATTMKLSTESVNGVFVALEQIVSKGKLSAEELRRQLGNRLPGAFQLFADGLGITTAQLDAFLRKGELTKDSLIDFANQLNKVYGPGVEAAADSLQGAANRLKNTIDTFTQSTGLASFFKGSVEALDSFIQSFANLAKYFTENTTAGILLVGMLALLNQSFLRAAGAKIADTTATIANTLATRISAYVKGLAATATTIYTAVTQASGAAAKSAAIAQGIWNAAVAANPLGAIIVVLTAAVALIASYSSNSKEAAVIERERVLLLYQFKVEGDKAAVAQKGINDQIRDFISLSYKEREELVKNTKAQRDNLKSRLDQLKAQTDTQIDQAGKLSGGRKALNKVKAFFSPLTGNTTSYKTYDARSADEQRNDVRSIFDPQIKATTDAIGKYNDEITQAEEITNAYSRAMATATDTQSSLEERERLFTVAQKNTVKGTQDHINALKGLADTRKLLKKYDDETQLKEFGKDNSSKAAAAERKRLAAIKKKEAEELRAFKASSDLQEKSLDLKLAEAENEYQLGERTYQDSVNFENKKLSLIENSIDFQLNLLEQYKDKFGKLTDEENAIYTKLLARKEQGRATYNKNINRLTEEEDKNEDKLEANRLKRIQREEALLRHQIEIKKLLADQEDQAKLNKIDLDVANSGNVGNFFGGTADNRREADRARYEVRVQSLQRDIQANADALAQMTQDDNNYFQTEKDLLEAKKQLVDEEAKYKISKAQEVAEAKKATEQAAIDFAMTLQSAYFDFMSSQSDQEIARIEKQKDHELELAGNNDTAKRKIEEKYNTKLVAEKRKAAKNERTQALFSIAVNGAIAAARALADYIYPYSLIVAGLAAGSAAAQAVVVANKPLPQYFKGREPGKSEFAEVNDRGWELIERNGKFRIENGGERTATYLHREDRVIPHEKSVKMVGAENDSYNSSNQFVSSLLQGGKVYRDAQERETLQLAKAIYSSRLSKSDIAGGMAAGLSGMSFDKFDFDERGFNRYTLRKNSRIKELHKRNNGL